MPFKLYGTPVNGYQTRSQTSTTTRKTPKHNHTKLTFDEFIMCEIKKRMILDWPVNIRSSNTPVSSRLGGRPVRLYTWLQMLTDILCFRACLSLQGVFNRRILGEEEDINVRRCWVRVLFGSIRRWSLVEGISLHTHGDGSPHWAILFSRRYWDEGLMSSTTGGELDGQGTQSTLRKVVLCETGLLTCLF